MKILLINPASKPEVVYSGDNNMYPFSLLFLSSFLYKNGYRARILDLSTCQNPARVLADYLRGKEFDIIGFTGTTANRFLVWDLITVSKRILPEAKMAVGGNHFSYTARETLEAINEVDVVVRGEGEITFLELVRSYHKRGKLDNILGISYRSKNSILHNPGRPFEASIDKFNIQEEVFDDIILPYGKYSPFMKMRNYQLYEDEYIDTLPIHVGRGCPGKCVFCIYNKKRYRTRTVDSVIEEIKSKLEKYNCDAFHLQDPHLIKRSGFIGEFCNRLTTEGIKIRWYAETRADIDLELLEPMRKAGCISLDFGLESASEKILRSIKKEITIEQAKGLIKRCSDLGIRIKVFSMISLPGEKKEDALKTLAFLNSFRRLITNFTGAVTRIYPGTDLEVMARRRGVIKENFSWYDRNYRNPLPDLTSGYEPLWIENLSPDFIRFCKKKIRRIQMSNASIFRLIATKSRRFVFNWREEGMKKKCQTVKRLFEYLSAKIIRIY